MKAFSNRTNRIFSFSVVLVLICSTFLCGCSSSKAVDSISEFFGFSLHTDNADTSTVDIEIYDLPDNKDHTEHISDSTNTVGDETLIAFEENETSEDLSDTNANNDAEDYTAFYDDINKIYSKQALSPDKITISFAGDFCLTEGCSVLNYMKRHDNDPSFSFNDDLFGRMTESDIFMINNEFPYSRGGSPREGKMYTFRANPDDAVLLNGFGVDIVSLANNHCYDYGPDALMDTFSTLRDIRMPYVGAGENIDEAMKPAYFNINGKTIAFVAATQIEGYANPETKEATETSPGVLRCLDTTKVKLVIAEAEEKSDFVICFVHWGTERSDLVRDWQRSEARDMVEAGADLIIGAHSHCLQGIDYVDGVPVFYSLGNYLFNSNTQDTCLVTATLSTSSDSDVMIDKLQFVPCIQSGGQTVTAGENDWARIIHYEQGISNHAVIDSDGYVTYSSEDHNIQNGQNTSPMRQDEESDSNKQSSKKN